MRILRAEERGITSYEWLDCRHTFSFGKYINPQWMGFSTLRVINDISVQPQHGFVKHLHKNMEIITYVMSGTLEQIDSLGNSILLPAGSLQRMGAGSGIEHSEINPSQDESVHFLQIWIIPVKANVFPSYQSVHVDRTPQYGEFKLFASPDGRRGSLKIDQDAWIFSWKAEAGSVLSYEVASCRSMWIQILSGSLRIGRNLLREGDGMGIQGDRLLDFVAEEDIEMLVFEFE